MVYSSPGERKHDIASEHLAIHEVKPGLFMILVSKAPALVWEAQMTGTGKLGPLCPNNHGHTSIIIRFISWTRTGGT
jgi:hypothetical protein